MAVKKEATTPRSRPVYIDLSDRGTDGKYSGGTRRYQRAALSLTEAIANGMDKFYKKSKESSNKRKDGFFVDLPQNLASGVSESLSDMSDIPDILTEDDDDDSSTDITRGLIRMPLRVFDSISDWVDYDDDDDD